jgi:hypothetical protein
MGSLQLGLPHPVDAETEEQFLKILKRKMTGAVSTLVDAVRAIEERYGPSAVEAIREQRLRVRVERAAQGGAEAADNSLRAFCAALEEGCRGSHEWQKIEDTDDRQAYRFTRCMWAEIFCSLDAEEIGFWLCEADGPVAAAFNPRIRFRRTRTLMEGDDYCDHVFYT